MFGSGERGEEVRSVLGVLAELSVGVALDDQGVVVDFLQGSWTIEDEAGGGYADDWAISFMETQRHEMEVSFPYIPGAVCTGEFGAEWARKASKWMEGKTVACNEDDLEGELFRRVKGKPERNQTYQEKYSINAVLDDILDDVNQRCE